MAVVKWRYEELDASATYTFGVNPNAMSSPFSTRALDIASTTAVDGQPLVTEGLRPPKEWDFSGVILAQAQYDAMNLWQSKRRRIYVYDHFARRFSIMLVQFDPKPGRRSAQFPFRHDYSVRALVFKSEVESFAGSGIYVGYAA